MKIIGEWKKTFEEDKYIKCRYKHNNNLIYWLNRKNKNNCNIGENIIKKTKKKQMQTNKDREIKLMLN
jgi:hypothetical protein